MTVKLLAHLRHRLRDRLLLYLANLFLRHSQSLFGRQLVHQLHTGLLDQIGKAVRDVDRSLLPFNFKAGIGKTCKGVLTLHRHIKHDRLLQRNGLVAILDLSVVVPLGIGLVFLPKRNKVRCQFVLQHRRIDRAAPQFLELLREKAALKIAVCLTHQHSRIGRQTSKRIVQNASHDAAPLSNRLSTVDVGNVPLDLRLGLDALAVLKDSTVVFNLSLKILDDHLGRIDILQRKSPAARFTHKIQGLCNAAAIILVCLAVNAVQRIVRRVPARQRHKPLTQLARTHKPAVPVHTGQLGKRLFKRVSLVVGRVDVLSLFHV